MKTKRPQKWLLIITHLFLYIGFICDIHAGSEPVPNFGEICKKILEIGRVTNYKQDLQSRLRQTELSPHLEHVFYYGISREELLELFLTGSLNPKPNLNRERSRVHTMPEVNRIYLEKHLDPATSWNSKQREEFNEISFSYAKASSKLKALSSVLRSQILKAGDFEDVIDEIVDSLLVSLDDYLEEDLNIKGRDKIRNGLDRISLTSDAIFYVLEDWKFPEFKFPEIVDSTSPYVNNLIAGLDLQNQNQIEKSGLESNSKNDPASTSDPSWLDGFVVKKDMEFKLRFLGHRMNEIPSLFMFYGTPAQKKLLDIFNSLPVNGGYVLSLNRSALDKLKKLDELSFTVQGALTFADILGVYPLSEDEKKYLRLALKIDL